MQGSNNVHVLNFGCVRESLIISWHKMLVDYTIDLLYFYPSGVLYIYIVSAGVFQRVMYVLSTDILYLCNMYAGLHQRNIVTICHIILAG